MRIATWDILEFCRDGKHASPDWPAEYWPKKPAPPSRAAWDQSVESLERDLEAMGKLVVNPKTDLLAPIDDIRALVASFAARGLRGHLLQVLDPADTRIVLASVLAQLRTKRELVVGRKHDAGPQ